MVKRWDESHALRKAFGHKVPKCPRQNHLGSPTVERAPAAMRQQGGHLWTFYICYSGTGGTHGSLITLILRIFEVNN